MRLHRLHFGRREARLLELLWGRGVDVDSLLAVQRLVPVDAPAGHQPEEARVGRGARRLFRGIDPAVQILIEPVENLRRHAADVKRSEEYTSELQSPSFI